MLVFYIVVTMLKVGICTPIDLFWEPNIEGTCLNEHIIFIADTVMSVVSDMVVLALPVPLLWSLQMPVKKKLKIAALLGAGGIATATGVVRLVLIAGPLATDRIVAELQFKLLGYVPNPIPTQGRISLIRFPQSRRNCYRNSLCLPPRFQLPLRPSQRRTNSNKSTIQLRCEDG
jgi:hypothetical protein